MSAKVEIDRPTTYKQWALEKVKPRKSPSGRLLFCRTRRLTNAPKYLVGGETKEERYHLAAIELTKLRNAGVLACTNGIWWKRVKPKPKLRVVK